MHTNKLHNRKMAEISKEQIRQICRSIELAIGQPVQTSKDFEKLSQQIFSRTGNLLSRNTLRRIWGIMNDGTNPRSSTVLILIHFLGYNSIENFLNATNNGENGPQSGYVMTRKLSVPVDLNIGDRIRLTWLPDRVCDIEYTGSLCFRVIASSQTRLQPGDTFQCSMIIDGEPLYLDQLQHHENGGKSSHPMSYVCGLEQGIRFERIN